MELQIGFFSNIINNVLGAGIPKMLGTIISHSLVHLCGGFPHLAPSHYYYLATGVVERASAYTSVLDVYDVEKRDLIDKVHIIKK